MKKPFLSTLLFFIALKMSIAGGILTNANQSAQYIRMLSRNASSQIDAVYYNPAGVVLLNDGFHFSLNNQSIFQTRTVENLFPLLNESTYKGDVTALLFPSAFVAYKKDRLALSFGVGLNSGGGSAEYKTGLPSFEIPISQLPSALNKLGVGNEAYSADLYFKGRSLYWGGQLNASWKFTDLISGAAGFRVIYARNKYDGHIRRISILVDGRSILAQDLFENLARQASGAAAALSQYPEDEVMPDETAAAYGFSSGTTYGTAAATLSGQSASATAYAAGLSDKYEQLEQKGVGITPIIGLNIKPNNRLNIGLKYEFKTKLTMTNHTDKDDLTLYPDGEEFRNDIPAVFTTGIDYKLLDNFKVSGSFSNYFDKGANWSGKENDVDKNYYELAFGMEYQLSEITAISAGVMHSETGVGRGFQTDISYSLSSNTVGFGMQFFINKQMDLDLGGLYTAYQDGYKETTYDGIGTYKEIYDKSSLVFSIGLTWHLLN